MTLDDIAASLPNGLHDAELRAVNIDFERGVALLDLDVWLGDEQEPEAYRQARIDLSRLLFWISDPPDPCYPFGEPGGLRIDAGPITDETPKNRPALPPVPPDRFANWIFVSDWNAFILFAACLDARRPPVSACRRRRPTTPHFAVALFELGGFYTRGALVGYVFE